jgi:hypothetical protein
MQHHVVGKHTAIPADVLERARGFSLNIAHPAAGRPDDVHLAVGVIRQAVTAGLIVGAGTFYRGIVLSYVKINGPRREGPGHAAGRLIEDLFLRPIEILRQNAVFRSVIARREQQRVCHIRLKTERFEPADHFE